MAEKTEQVIETTYENEKVRMKVKMKDGKLYTISFYRKDTGRHLFSLKQLDNGNLKKSQQVLWDLCDIIYEAQSLFSELGGIRER